MVQCSLKFRIVQIIPRPSKILQHVFRSKGKSVIRNSKIEFVKEGGKAMKWVDLKID